LAIRITSVWISGVLLHLEQQNPETNSGRSLRGRRLVGRPRNRWKDKGRKDEK